MVKTFELPLHEAEVGSLVRELRFHTSCGVAKKKKKKKNAKFELNSLQKNFSQTTGHRVFK